MTKTIQPADLSPGYKALENQATDKTRHAQERDSLRLSEDIDGYNNLLKNYQLDLYRWLSNAKSFKQFEQRISDEVVQFGLSDWSFTRLNGMDKVQSNTQGENSKRDIEAVIADIFCECDLLLQHARVCETAIYQSQIVDYVRAAPFTTEPLERFLLMSAVMKQQGYADIYCIPVVDTLDESRSAFCVTSKGMSTQMFKDSVAGSSEILTVLGKAINDVGTLHYADCLVDARARYQALVQSQPFNLLATMVNYDMSDIEKTSGICVRTVIYYLTRIRKRLLSKT